jgi:hemoglobin
MTPSFFTNATRIRHRALPALLGSMLLSAMVACSTPAPPQPTLFERLRGLPALSAVADKLVDRSAADPRTRRSFEGVKLKPLKASITSQLCQATGGPCKYEGESMANAHKGLAISSAEFDALVGNLIATLDEFHVGAREKSELIQMLAPMKSDIVTK